MPRFGYNRSKGIVLKIEKKEGVLEVGEFEQGQPLDLVRLFDELSLLVHRIYTMKGSEEADLSLIKRLMGSSSFSAREQESIFRLLGELKTLEEGFHRTYWLSENYKILLETTNSFLETFDREEIYEKAYELVSKVMAADAFFIALYHEESGELYIPYFRDGGLRYDPVTMRFGRGVVSEVIRRQEMISVSTKQEAEELNHVKWGNPDQDTNAALFIPLFQGDGIKGVISVQSYKAYAYRDEDKDLLKTIGVLVLHAIESVDLYEQVSELSYRDELTGMRNRRALKRDLKALFEEWQEGSGVITLAVLDADHLKEVNDGYGHEIGDRLIKWIGKGLKEAEGKHLTSYRYGGDEFIVLLRTSSAEESRRMVSSIREELMRRPLAVNGVFIDISMSVGVASFPRDAPDPEALFQRADEALYLAKRNKKSGLIVYGENHNP